MKKLVGNFYSIISLVLIFSFFANDPQYLFSKEKMQPQVVLTTRDNKKIELTNVRFITGWKCPGVHYVDARWYRKKLRFWFRSGIFIKSINWDDISSIEFLPEKKWNKRNIGKEVFRDLHYGLAKITYLDKTVEEGLIPFREGFIPLNGGESFYMRGNVYLHGESEVLGKKGIYEKGAEQLKRIEKVDNKNFKVIAAFGSEKVEKISSPEFWLHYSDNCCKARFDNINSEIPIEVGDSTIKIKAKEIKRIIFNEKKIVETKKGDVSEGNIKIEKIIGRCLNTNRIVFTDLYKHFIIKEGVIAPRYYFKEIEMK